MDPISIILSIAALVFSVWSFLNTRGIVFKQMRSSTYSAIMGRLFELNQLELEYPQLFEQLYNNFDSSAIKKGGGGLGHYLFMLFNLYAEIHTQHEKYGFFDEEQMRVWENRIENDFRQRQFLRGYWKSERKNFSNEYTQNFTDFINRALERVEPNAAQ